MSNSKFDLTGLADGVAKTPETRRVGVAPPPRREPRPVTPAPVTPLVSPVPELDDEFDVDSELKPAPQRAPRSRTAPKARPNKVTIRLHPDQRRLLGELANRFDLFRTQTLAAAIDRYLPDVRKAGTIARPPRRPHGPRPGEETVDYQIDIDAARMAKLQDVAQKVSDGDISAVVRAVLDQAFVGAGYELGPRPRPLPALDPFGPPRTD